MSGTLAAQDILFTNNLAGEILGYGGPNGLVLPSYMYGDNVASLFLAQNNSVGQRTKHIDIRHRFMHDLIVSGQIELRHVRSEDNTSDINSKNVALETHTKHANSLYNGLALVRVNDKFKEEAKKSNKKKG